MLFAGDIIPVRESVEELSADVKALMKTVVEKGLKASKNETEFIILNFNDKNRENVKMMLGSRKVKSCLYLRLTIASDASVNQGIMERIRRLKWRKASGVLW